MFCFTAVLLTACSKKKYYYETYQIGVRYSTSQQLADTVSYLDSATTYYDSFRGDTLNYGPDPSFYLSGSYYKKRSQFFEVYRYTR